MTFKLKFKKQAKKEWDQLDNVVRKMFAKKLKERKENPRIESSRLREFKDCYKIKLRSAGYRLAYEVRDQEMIIVVIAVGKREKNKVYLQAHQRM